MSGDGPAVAFARVLVDELVRCGLRDLCLSPGSRSAPLAVAALADERVRVHVRIDERSASFLALGIARGSGRPAAVLTTSGSATANLHPAVVEADTGRVPLLVLTADRPPELRHTGANQTIDQRGLFGRAVRWDVEVGVPEDRDGANAHWRSTACRAWAEAVGAGGAPGPVHLNLALRDPLVPGVGGPVATDLSGRPDGRPWTAADRLPRPPHPDAVAALAEACAVERGVVLVGETAADPAPLAALAAHLGWPLLAEPHSSARLPGAVAHHDLLLRHAAFAQAHRPELVLTVGRVGLARSLLAWLGGAPQVLVDPDAAWLDPVRDVGGIVVGDPALTAVALLAALPEATGGRSWLAGWHAADAAVAGAIDAALARGAAASEPQVARDLADALPGGAALTVASSMPIRDLDLFLRPRAGLRIVANRGASGIDGFVSTAVGVALGHEGPAYALAGDLSLLHDQNGLLIAEGEPRPNLVIVVVNNDGGGIFSFLPQEQALEPAPFERAFGTPHGVDLAHVAAASRVGHHRVQAAADLVPAVEAAVRARGIQLVEVRTDRGANLALHRRLAEAAAAALDGLA